MASIETYRKQAKQLVRWHRERNYSVGGKLRQLARYRHLSDVEVLAMALPLTLAQEVVAVEAGFPSWAALKAEAGPAAQAAAAPAAEPLLIGGTPILFVRDVSAAAAYYEASLGFRIDFLHGKPPFYGSVSRDGFRLHLRFVHQPNFAELAAREGSLILASIEVANVKALFQEFETRGVTFAQRLVRQAWGGIDFQVCDPDGNVLSFVEYRQPGPPAGER